MTSLDYSIDRDADVCFVTIVGSLGEATLMSARPIIEAILNHPDFHSHMRVLVDARRGDWQSTDLELESIALFAGSLKDKFQGRNAVVVKTMELGEIFHTYARFAGFHMEYFNDIDDARDWLLESEES